MTTSPVKKSRFIHLYRATGARALAVTLAGLLTLGGSAVHAQEEKILNLYNWAEYIGDDTVANFEKETGIKVRQDYFDGNEILHAKLVAQRSGYDIVIPSAVWAASQIQGGLLKRLDKTKLPNLANMDPQVQAKMSKLDPNNDHLVSWLWGFTTVGINTAKVKVALGDLPMPENVWDLVFDPKYVSRLKSCGVSFVDTAADVVPIALLYLKKNPYSNQEADYREVSELLQRVRPSVTLFSSVGYINDLARGSVCVALGWSGDINIARQRAIEWKTGFEIKALIPKTGGLLVFDTMAIPVDAPHPNNALLFMNYIMRPEVHAGLTNRLFYSNANLGSVKHVRKDIAENRSVFLDKTDFQRMVEPEMMKNDVRRRVVKVYTKFKTGV